MGRMDEGSPVCASSEVHRHGFVRLLVMVQGRLLPGLAYTSFHRGNSGEHRLVQQDTTGVVEEID
jgi:hypothetical protein